MDTDDFVSGVQRYDAEFFDRFGFKIEEILEDFVADRGSGDWVVFEIIAVAAGADLFEGVELNIIYALYEMFPYVQQKPTA
jgi:hypothetical protein